LFSGLASSQQVFDEIFDRADSFPLWFGLMALLASGSNLINAKIVVTLGMREVVRRVLLVQGSFTLLYVLLLSLNLIPEALAFPLAFVWLTSIFYLAGFGIGNMNALALEPLGHMAGLAASIITALATIGAALISVPIGLSFDGTLLPLSVGVGLCVCAALFILRYVEEDSQAMA
ncbi:MAG: multidrug MFS transporter, partial [Pseudomonadota bacterium]